jgi:hypothetical protein
LRTELGLEWPAMHPLARNIVIAAVALLIAAGLIALGLLTADPQLSVITLIAGGLIAAGVGVFLFAQGWIWSRRAYHLGRPMRSMVIAFIGGSMILLTAFALALTLILVILFFG